MSLFLMTVLIDLDVTVTFGKVSRDWEIFKSKFSALFIAITYNSVGIRIIIFLLIENYWKWILIISISIPAWSV